MDSRKGTIDGDSIVGFAAGDTIRLDCVEVVADRAKWERSQVDRVECGSRLAIADGGVILVNSSLSLAAHTNGDLSAWACLRQGQSAKKSDAFRRAQAPCTPAIFSRGLVSPNYAP